MLELLGRQAVRELDRPVLGELQSKVHGKVILPEQPEYDSARKIWNGMIDRYPAVIVRCSDASDVVEAIRFARSHDLVISVRGGGHGFPGYATVDDGIVIDLSFMKDILVDPQRQTALVSAGLTLGEFMQATQVYGLATTTGTASDTGVAGLTLGGGLGYLMSKYGLACDNVISYEMVTADGEIVQASAVENTDLYWGLRGGGGNFGIVTKFEFQLHPVTTVLSGLLFHPMAKAREVLRFYRDFAEQSPDELTVYSAMLTSPDGHPVVAMIPCFFGDLKEGEHIMEPLRKFGPPVGDTVRPMSYSEVVHLIDEITPRGRMYYAKSRTLPKLPDSAIDLMAEAGESMTTPFCQVLNQYIHGAAARVAPGDTAFVARGESYMPIFVAAWENGPAEPHIEWARKNWAAFKPFSIEAGYVNFMSADGPNQVALTYGSNYARLLELKRRYDPDNIFRMNANIQP